MANNSSPDNYNSRFDKILNAWAGNNGEKILGNLTDDLVTDLDFDNLILKGYDDFRSTALDKAMNPISIVETL